ncbi:hypothetical protein M9Y10_009665 [Tritrichomonas musculus]|uniref:Uncharacterized protein n=1 Tax=Tritrichomonas musculus TaxID=1915356 RepID=A0ABR2IP08_9EUKA
MPGTLNDALKLNKCDIDTIIEALNAETNALELRITQKAGKRLISILKEEIDQSNGFQKVLKVLSTLSRNDIVVNQMVNSGPDLSSICDKMLSKAISSKKGDVFDQKSLIIFFDLINQSDKLKSQLCMSIQEYILTSIEQKTIQNSILPKSMEILVSAVTHHQENRTFFIKNTSKEKISAVFKLTKSTGNTMVQIFSVEFLWRVAIPMRMSNEERNKIFGKYAQKLFTIRADSFREGILDFVETINQDRNDSQRILHVKIRDLMIGNAPISGTHNLYFGSDSILLWVTKNSNFAQYRNNIELITLRNSDISGVGVVNGNTWCIGITQDFDTLPDFFETSHKTIFFQVIDENKAIMTIAQQRFGKIHAPKMPRPRQLLLEKQPLTPKPQANASLNSENPKAKKKSITPKSMKAISDESIIKTTQKIEKPPKKSPSSSKSKATPSNKITNAKSLTKSTEQKPKINIKKELTPNNKPHDIKKQILPTSSSSESSDFENEDHNDKENYHITKEEDRNYESSSDVDDEEMTKKKKTSHIKEEKKSISSSKKQTKVPSSRADKKDTIAIVSKRKSSKIKSENKKERTKSVTQKHKEKIPPAEDNNFSQSSESNSSSLSSDSEIKPNEVNNNQIDDQEQDEEIPLVKIGGSYKDGFSSDEDVRESDSTDSSEPNLPDNNDIEQSTGHQIKIEPPTLKNEKEEQVYQRDSTKFVAVKKRREYTPEKWELDTFDELKNFGSAIRSRLSERHLMLNRAIEDTVSQSLKEISDFMAKCDADLDQLRNDFTTSSHQISSDIDQKQKMVIQLGEQQSEHITQMLHDCELLQKRAQELVKRFGQQKKALITNQEKHIALFREDMRSEVKAAMTTKKRESSKKLVQKLVTLLDEL